MRTIFVIAVILSTLALLAGEKQLWRAAIPDYLLRDAGPVLTGLDIVSVTEEEGDTVLYIWETAERAALLADTARTLTTLPLRFAETPAYRTYEEINATLYAIEKKIPGHAKVYRIGSSVEGRDILALKLSVSPAENLPGPPEVIFVGLHHAREWISAEVTLHIAEHLADHIGDMPRIRSIVEGSELWFIPVLNPDGYIYTYTTDRMWRFNRRPNADGTYGVDLNRNYDAAWIENGNDHGTGPFSEPETRAIRDLVVTPEGGTALTDQPRGIVTYHSYAQLILYPWASTSDPAPTAGLMKATADTMADLILYAGGVIYNVKQTYGLYAAPIFGECTEWFYNATEQGTGFTIELRPVTVDEGGFGLDPEFIEPTARENIAAALYFVESLIYHTVDIDTDTDRNGTADYLDVPDTLIPSDDDALLDDADEVLPDTNDASPDADNRPLPRPRDNGCSITFL